jgi:hypothetical protein
VRGAWCIATRRCGVVRVSLRCTAPELPGISDEEREECDVCREPPLRRASDVPPMTLAGVSRISDPSSLEEPEPGGEERIGPEFYRACDNVSRVGLVLEEAHMSERRMPLKPTRSPRSEDVKSAAARARESRERLRAKYPGRIWPDSTEAVREDRDTRY